MSAAKNPERPMREGFTPAENAWLDEVASRHVPLSESQIMVIRRHFGPSAVRRKRGGAAA
jgi:hypothetical protein